MKGIYTTIGGLAIFATHLFAYAQEQNQYLVFLASEDPFIIQQARTIAPDAFAGSLDSGRRVLQLGRYNNLNLAQRRSEELRALGLPIDIARVASRARVPQDETNLPAPGGFAPPASTVVSTIPIRPAPEMLPGVPGTLEPAPTIEITRPPAPVNNVPNAIPNVLPNVMPETPAPAIAQEVQAFAQRNRFFVIIPTTSEEVLARVRQINPTARLAASERGAYIEIRGFPDRGSAEVLNRDFRNRGFDSRVIFL